MSAELLRRAATLMRERAQAATEGPWSVAPWDEKLVLPKAWADEAGDPDTRPPFVAIHSTESAAHIAAWHPAVASAVADWLDYQAGSFYSPEAVIVARAYLGEQP